MGEDFEDDHISVSPEKTEETSHWKEDFERTILASRARIRTMVKSPFWFWLIQFLVFVNTALRCSVYHDMPEWWGEILLQLEVTFLFIFSGQLNILFKKTLIG